MPYYLRSSASLILHHHHYVESFISCFLFGFSTASKRVHCNITKKAHFWKQEKKPKLMSKQKENLQPAKSKLLFPLFHSSTTFSSSFLLAFPLWKTLESLLMKKCFCFQNFFLIIGLVWWFKWNQQTFSLLLYLIVAKRIGWENINTFFLKCSFCLFFVKQKSCWGRF